MKRGGLLKRVSHARDARSSGTTPVKEDKGPSLAGPNEKYKAINSPIRKDLAKNRNVEKGGGGGSLLKRFVNRRKKGAIDQPTYHKATTTTTTTAPCSLEDRGDICSLTPVTVDSDLGTEVEVPIVPPSCERVPSYAETEQTHEISQFSGQGEEVEVVALSASSPSAKKHPQSQQVKTTSPIVTSTNKMTRSSSARLPAKQQLILDTSAVPLGMSRSMRLSRKSGNESLGDAKPDQPVRGQLPPLLGTDDDVSASESTCSGITMDFTYGETSSSVMMMMMKTPMRQPVGRLGEGVSPPSKPNSFAPPSFITMNDADDDSDSLDEY